MENCKIFSIDEGYGDLIVYYKDENISKVYYRESGYDGMCYYLGNDIKFNNEKYIVLDGITEKRTGTIVK